jgi:hypothetical protein
MCYFIYSYQYFHTTFLSALKINTQQHLRAFLIKFFFIHTFITQTLKFKLKLPFLKEGRIIVKTRF